MSALAVIRGRAPRLLFRGLTPSEWLSRSSSLPAELQEVLVADHQDLQALIVPVALAVEELEWAAEADDPTVAEKRRAAIERLRDALRPLGVAP